MNTLVSQIQQSAKQKHHPDNSEYMSISIVSVTQISNEFSIEGKDVEIAALENNIVPERYARNLKTFSCEEQAKMLKSSVTVVGLGGLGGTTSEILSRIGIGTLTLLDGDVFDDHNLNRQLFSTIDDLKKPKAEAAAKRIEAINDSIRVNVYKSFINHENIQQFVENSDVVVDCLDQIDTRFLLEKAAKSAGVPFVSAAVGGIAGQITTIYPTDPGLKLIYGEEKELSDVKGAETTLGCQPQAVFMIASLECSEVVKVILKKENSLRNRLMIVDMASNTYEILKLC